NSELRERLSNIHAESRCVPEPSTGLINLSGPLQKQDSTDGSHPLVHQASNESRASITESLSEFFDAQEVLLSASSSENEASDDDSYISDNNGTLLRRRRSCLPSASPNTSNISLWNILKNNIGKDLSKVAMPVQLNEPLNTLQRLCEELEYSELLDKAANTQDPFERMRRGSRKLKTTLICVEEERQQRRGSRKLKTTIICVEEERQQVFEDSSNLC
ncbi:unnamed protein product, partial [Coregonus sp. 'balchen']